MLFLKGHKVEWMAKVGIDLGRVAEGGREEYDQNTLHKILK